MTRLDEIKARLEAATPGPWTIDGPWYWPKAYGSADESGLVTSMNDRSVVAIQPKNNGSAAKGDNMTFIAHAPEDIGWLVAEVERLNESDSLLTSVATVMASYKDKLDESRVENSRLVAEVERQAAVIAKQHQSIDTLICDLDDAWLERDEALDHIAALIRGGD